MFFRKKDPEDRIIYGNHPGDWGVVIIAAIITLGFIYLLLTPQNFGAAFQAVTKGAPGGSPPQPQSKPGETQMMLFDAQKKQK